MVTVYKLNDSSMLFFFPSIKLNCFMLVMENFTDHSTQTWSSCFHCSPFTI